MFKIFLIQTLIHEGGLVPKTLYKMGSLDEEDPKASSNAKEAGSLSHEHQNLYKTVELKTGYVYEVYVRNEDPKSVLTWDFDVIRSDLHFTLYRANKELPEKTGWYRHIFWFGIFGLFKSHLINRK